MVNVFSISPHLGPLQISLGRMIIDIIKFFFIYMLVLFAFGCGINLLINPKFQIIIQHSSLFQDWISWCGTMRTWNGRNVTRYQEDYPTGMKKKRLVSSGDDLQSNFIIQINPNYKFKWTHLHTNSLFETSQSLFWASFGLVDLQSFELTGIKSFTRFWGLLMFGSYSLINIIVLLNMLIAMMSNSYAVIAVINFSLWYRLLIIQTVAWNKCLHFTGKKRYRMEVCSF